MRLPTFVAVPGQPWLYLPVRLWPWLGLGMVLVGALVLPLPGWLAGLACGLVLLGTGLLGIHQAGRARVKVCPQCQAMLPRADTQCHGCGFREEAPPL